MPLPADHNIVNTAQKLVDGLRGAYGTPEQYRPAHAKGRLVKGTFVPTSAAGELSKALHFNTASTPVIVRLSNSTGIPSIPDKDPNANPRGMGIRFILSDDGHHHTDIITHSTAFFPASTGEGFLQFLAAVGNGTIRDFLDEHPPAAAFVKDPKPAPVSFASEKFFGVNAFKFVSREGKETYIRYRIVPEEYKVLAESEIASKSNLYLFEELAHRLSMGPFTMKLIAQIAEEGDITDDATKHWPEERKLIELGTLQLKELETAHQSSVNEKQLILDPIPRIAGVEPSMDPLLDVRAAVYLLSGRIRRAA